MTKTQANIAAMLAEAGRKVSVIDTSECCVNWARSGKSLGTLQRPNGVMRWVPARDLTFCPWCGLARPNDKVSDPATPK